MILFGKLKTIFSLGLVHVFRVSVYRLLLKYGLHPVCFIKFKQPTKPFFKEPSLDKLDINPVSGWEDKIILFDHINIDLNNQLPHWLTNPITKADFSTKLDSWWKIPDFGEDVGDIKIIWEQSRMNWLIPFAQKARNGDYKSLEKMNDWLDDWLKVNPPYLGMNWKCGQEASIRIINLACAALILGQEKEISYNLQNLIVLHLKRIAPTIHYAIGQQNNHGTSEAAALFIGGSWLNKLGFKEGSVWEKKGRFWLENRIKRLVSNDGSFSQYSLNYHRMLLDTISFTEVWRQRLGLRKFSEELYKKSSSATLWLYQMISKENGEGPNFGANDGTRLLPLSDSSYRDYRPSVQLAMVLFNGHYAYRNEGILKNQLAWLDVKARELKPPRYEDCDFQDGGFAILRNKESNLFITYPNFKFRPSQADGLHIDLWVNDKNLLSDAGSYSYNSNPDLSWYFSGTASHNTVQFDDRDQMPKISKFLFSNWLKLFFIRPLTKKNNKLKFSAGYKDYLGAKHVRDISLGDKSLKVTDCVSGFKDKAILRWRLNNSDWSIDKINKGIKVSDSIHSLSITSDVLFSDVKLTEGWESLYYLQRRPVPVLEIEVKDPGLLYSTYTW